MPDHSSSYAPSVSTVARDTAMLYKGVDTHFRPVVWRGSIASSVLTTAVAIRRGDYRTAASEGSAVFISGATSEIAYRADRHLGRIVAGVGHEVVGDILKNITGATVRSAVRAGGEEIPVVGGVVAIGFAAWDVGKEVVGAVQHKNSWAKVGTTAAANVVEVGGGLVGFGAGQIGRQAVVEISRHTLGENNTPSDAAAVSIAKDTISAYQAFTAKNDEKTAAPVVATGQHSHLQYARRVAHHSYGALKNNAAVSPSSGVHENPTKPAAHRHMSLKAQQASLYVAPEDRLKQMLQNKSTPKNSTLRPALPLNTL